MSYTVVVHLAGEVPVLGEIEELPKPADTVLTVSNPRQREGKHLDYLDQNVLKVIWPIERVTLIEVLKSAKEDKIIGFVRE